MAIKELNLDTPPPVCSFCGEAVGVIELLIRSRGHYICNHCVEQINDLLKDDEERDSI